MHACQLDADAALLYHRLPPPPTQTLYGVGGGGGLGTPPPILGVGNPKIQVLDFGSGREQKDGAKPQF